MRPTPADAGLLAGSSNVPSTAPAATWSTSSVPAAPAGGTRGVPAAIVAPDESTRKTVASSGSPSCWPRPLNALPSSMRAPAKATSPGAGRLTSPTRVVPGAGPRRAKAKPSLRAAARAGASGARPATTSLPQRGAPLASRANGVVSATWATTSPTIVHGSLAPGIAVVRNAVRARRTSSRTVADSWAAMRDRRRVSALTASRAWVRASPARTKNSTRNGTTQTATRTTSQARIPGAIRRRRGELAVVRRPGTGPPGCHRARLDAGSTTRSQRPTPPCPQHATRALVAYETLPSRQRAEGRLGAAAEAGAASPRTPTAARHAATTPCRRRLEARCSRCMRQGRYQQRHMTPVDPNGSTWGEKGGKVGLSGLTRGEKGFTVGSRGGWRVALILQGHLPSPHEA